MHRRDLKPQDVNRTLSDVGNAFYDQLLPPLLKDLCWTFREQGVKTVMVLSDEPHIPWELIKPYRVNPVTGEFEKEDNFWGEVFALTRWLRGRPPVEQLSFRRVCAVAADGASVTGQGGATVRDFAPDAPASAPPPALQGAGEGRLKAAEAELAIVRSLGVGGAQVNVLPARTQALREVFDRGDFDLLHLAAHGAFGGLATAEASAVLMEDGPFSASELSPRMCRALRRAAPLIFFNACHSGRIGFSLTSLGSWGARLIELGCGGFVGSLWPVTDEAALAFAGAFYQAMSAGTPIGEAVRRARLLVNLRYPNDPTWMAYCCFADPMARIREERDLTPDPLPANQD